MSFRGPGTGEDGCRETQGERPLELGTFGIVWNAVPKQYHWKLLRIYEGDPN